MAGVVDAQGRATLLPHCPGMSAPMTDADRLRYAFQDPKPPTRREVRAQRTRAHALSPTRIFMQLLLVPVVTVVLTVAIYTRTSPYEPRDALRHLLALTGCDAAVKFGVAPAYRGELGYHARNDEDGDGVACAGESSALAETAPETGGGAASGAKFLRP